MITLKLEPKHGEWLRQYFGDIIPGYYMNKEHWNPLYLESEISDEMVKDMLDDSCNLVFGSLSKKVQKEILED